MQDAFNQLESDWRSDLKTKFLELHRPRFVRMIRDYRISCRLFLDSMWSWCWKFKKVVLRLVFSDEWMEWELQIQISSKVSHDKCSQKCIGGLDKWGDIEWNLKD